MSTKTITLDFYNHNIEYLKAKQGDIGRNVKIICTDHGKKVYLDSATVSAFVKYKKSDGNFSFNECIIQSDDGTVLMELTSQMLSVIGKHVFEIIIVNSTGLKADNLSEVHGFEDLGVSIISTMPFYVNVVAGVLDTSNVTSLSEFDALNVSIARLAATENRINSLISDTNSSTEDCAEAIKKANEAAANANSKASIANTAANNANTKANAADEAAINANDMATRANTAAARVETAISNAEKATTAATTAADRFDRTMNRGGIVLSNEKGAANGIATLDQNKKILSGQLPMVNTIENALISTDCVFDAQALAVLLQSLHTVYTGSEDPSNDLGKDGDIYMKIIVDDTEEIPVAQGGE